MRIQLEMPEARVQRLKDLMEEIGVDTYKDLFNNALSILDWCVEQVQEGREIAALKADENKYRELSMPALDHAAHRQKKSVSS